MDKNCFINLFFVFFMCCFLILNAAASIEGADIELSKKDLRAIKIMESRHFDNKIATDTNNHRICRLEIELLGRTFENLALCERIKTLKLASSKRMLTGAAVPVQIERNFSAKRMQNNSIKVIPKNDDVGIIDGLMKVYAPELFKNYRELKERNFEIFYD